VFDALNLPAVINENAVQTLLLNQDRWAIRTQQDLLECIKLAL
jgi:hypothetical protein